MQEKMCVLQIGDIQKEYPYGTTFETVAKEFQKDFEDDIVLVFHNLKLKELRKRVKKDGIVTFVTTKDSIGRRVYRRSVALVMQKAIHNLYGKQNVRVKILHSIGQGHYCELTNFHEITQEDIDAIKHEMNSITKNDLPIIKETWSAEDAISLFRTLGMYDKERLFRYRRSSSVNIYELDHYKDYFYGYMVPSTSYVPYFEVEKYQDGFVLVYPDKNTKKVERFVGSDKLFQTLKESSKWGETLEIDTIGALNDAIADGRSDSIILIQEALMEQKIGQLAEEIAKSSEKKFIMIAGPSSSGKTTFSHRLSIQLSAHGLKPHPFPLDDYYLDHDLTPLDENGQPDYECLEALDVERFNQDMNALLQGMEVETPIFNFKTGKREAVGKKIQLKENDVLVIEGIHGLNDKLSYLIPKEKKFKIYISALKQLSIDEHNTLPTTDGRLIRRIVRDARTRGTSARETIAMWSSVRRGEERNIFPFQESADVMFNSALIYEIAVLKTFAEPLLFSIEPDMPEYQEAKRLLKFLDYFLGMPTMAIANNSILREFIGGSCFHV